MEKVIDITSKQNYTQLAVEKIAEELKTFKGDRYGEAVKKHVASTITHFCEQEPRFAEVVYKTKRTLSDCCAEIMKGCGTSISDIDVYRGAVKNYFPNAEVVFTMTISIDGDAPSEDEMNREVRKAEPKKPAKAAAPKPEKPKAAKPAPAPKPKAVQPAKAPEKPKEKSKAPEVIQLTLFCWEGIRCWLRKNY